MPPPVSVPRLHFPPTSSGTSQSLSSPSPQNAPSLSASQSMRRASAASVASTTATVTAVVDEVSAQQSKEARLEAHRRAHVDMQGKSLSAVPSLTWTMGQTLTLDLSSNELMWIDAALIVSCCPLLQTLHLRDNLLADTTSLVGLGKLTQLTLLDISGNPVCDAFSRLTILEHLLVDPRPKENLAPEPPKTPAAHKPATTPRPQTSRAAHDERMTVPLSYRAHSARRRPMEPQSHHHPSTSTSGGTVYLRGEVPFPALRMLNGLEVAPFERAAAAENAATHAALFTPRSARGQPPVAQERPQSVIDSDAQRLFSNLSLSARSHTPYTPSGTINSFRPASSTTTHQSTSRLPVPPSSARSAHHRPSTCASTTSSSSSSSSAWTGRPSTTVTQSTFGFESYEDVRARVGAKGDVAEYIASQHRASRLEATRMLSSRAASVSLLARTRPATAGEQLVAETARMLAESAVREKVALSMASKDDVRNMRMKNIVLGKEERERREREMVRVKSHQQRVAMIRRGKVYQASVLREEERAHDRKEFAALVLACRATLNARELQASVRR